MQWCCALRFFPGCFARTHFSFRSVEYFNKPRSQGSYTIRLQIVNLEETSVWETLDDVRRSQRGSQHTAPVVGSNDVIAQTRSCCECERKRGLQTTSFLGVLPAVVTTRPRDRKTHTGGLGSMQNSPVGPCPAFVNSN